jgi:competence protein ComEC
MITKTAKKIIITLAFLVAIFYLSKIYYQEKNDQDLLVSFIDSGQADAILIKTPYQQNIIIDFGSNKGLKDLSERIPWWDKNIDLMIITHPHDDHILGMISILNKYKVENIMYTGVLHYSPAYLELLELIKYKNIPLIIPKENQIIEFGNNCSMKVIFPWESFKGKEVENINNSSIVNQLDCNNFKFLFAGDAEIEVESEILEKDIDIKSDVLKAGHHGSITSSQEEFLKKVNPQIAIIMVGEGNKFGHPSLRTIKRLEKLNIKSFRTDLHGTIDIISNGQNLYIKED